jgi:hypothetical protein
MTDPSTLKYNSPGAPLSFPSSKEPTRAASGPAIISRQRLIALATLAARAQNSGLREAEAPKIVMIGIRDLNAVAGLARDVLAGRKEAGGQSHQSWLRICGFAVDFSGQAST